MFMAKNLNYKGKNGKQLKYTLTAKWINCNWVRHINLKSNGNKASVSINVMNKETILKQIFLKTTYSLRPFVWSLKMVILSNGLFPWRLSGKEFTCQYGRHRFDPWVRNIPWRRKWQPTAVFLSGKPHGQRSLEGYSPWVTKESVTRQQDIK